MLLQLALWFSSHLIHPHPTRFLTQVDQDNYPEHLGEMFLINCPTFFSMVWSIVKPLLDDRTRRKIHVLTAAKMEVMFEVIDRDVCPAQLGGRCSCPGGCLYSNLGPWSDPKYLDRALGSGGAASTPAPPASSPAPAASGTAEVVDRK